MKKDAPKYDKWLQSPSRFLSMTGYKIKDIQRLLPYFSSAHDTYLSKYELNGQKKRGGHRHVIYENSPLPNHAERLCFILLYIKHNPVQKVQAEMFGMEQRQCHTYIHGLQHILDLALTRTESMPAWTEKELESKLNSLANKELLHDGTEREIPRPRDEKAQKDQYSGKKKKHTIKNAILSTMMGMIIFVSPTYAMRIHDMKMTASYSVPSGSIL